jgi:hypothetical protein
VDSVLSDPAAHHDHGVSGFDVVDVTLFPQDFRRDDAAGSAEYQRLTFEGLIKDKTSPTVGIPEWFPPSTIPLWTPSRTCLG